MTNARSNARKFAEFWLLVRFVLVGALNSAFHAIVVLALSVIAPSLPGFGIILVAWFCAIPVGYLSQAKLVWHARLSWSGLARLALSQVPSIVVSTGLSAIAGAIGLALFWQEVIALVSGAAVSYVLQRYWVFRDRNGKSMVVREEV